MRNSPAQWTSSKISRRTVSGILLSTLLAGSASRSVASTETSLRPPPSRGFNVAGWLDRKNGRAPASFVLNKLRKLGFETVRLPVDPTIIATNGALGPEPFLMRVRTAIAELVATGFSVIVDLHPSDKLVNTFQHSPYAAEQLTIRAWRRLRDVIAAFPVPLVYAELLNEPPMAGRDWLSLRNQLAKSIRIKCPHHTLIWGPARYQGIWELVETQPLSDKNSLAAIHYYTPIAFTHQCENWYASPLSRIANLPFPATPDSASVIELANTLRKSNDSKALTFLKAAFDVPWTYAHIYAEFARVRKWSEKFRCRVILDEFGVLNFCVDHTSRANWVRAVRKAAESNGVGWLYWELDQGFGFIKDRNSLAGFDHTMLSALLSNSR